MTEPTHAQLLELWETAQDVRDTFIAGEYGNMVGALAGHLNMVYKKVDSIRESLAPTKPREMWVTKHRDNISGRNEMVSPRVLFFKPDDPDNWFHVREVLPEPPKETMRFCEKHERITGAKSGCFGGIGTGCEISTWQKIVE